jgi:glycosyltransferase involved in cell wall biosynthesis
LSTDPGDELNEMDLTQRNIRIAVLNSHPIQYFAPLYAYINSANAGLEVTALYLSDYSIRGGRDEEFGQALEWDIDLLAGYSSVFLGRRDRLRVPNGFWSLFAPDVWSELKSGKYDALWLHGHNYASNLLALLASKTTSMHVLMRGETHLGLTRRGVKNVLRRPIMRSLYSACDGLLAIGTANADFYRAMGVPDRKIFLTPYSVDNDRFMRESRLTAEQRRQVRERFGIAVGVPAILFAAKFTRRKRPLDLIEAIARLRPMTSRAFTVAMVGSGELEGELRALCAKHGLDNVVFPGFVNQVDLPCVYGACDVFVLPSEQEPWGLAVNEAMCAGLPVVVSREVGCVPDLVKDGVNGFTPSAGDIHGLAEALRRLIENDVLRQDLGKASLTRISHWSYQECLHGLRQALSHLTPRKSARSAPKHFATLQEP